MCKLSSYAPKSQKVSQIFKSIHEKQVKERIFSLFVCLFLHTMWNQFAKITIRDALFRYANIYTKLIRYTIIIITVLSKLNNK